MSISYCLQSNILINDNGEASLSDYGLSRILEISGFTTNTQSATWRYAAPELFSEDNFNPVATTGWRWIACELMADRSDEGGECIQRATIATDVWSFAMTVIEVRKFATSLLYKC
jgi:serine/threonine protein kinase